MVGGVLSISNVALSRSAVSAPAGEFEGASDANTLITYVPSGTDVVSHV